MASMGKRKNDVFGRSSSCVASADSHRKYVFNRSSGSADIVSRYSSDIIGRNSSYVGSAQTFPR